MPWWSKRRMICRGIKRPSEFILTSHERTKHDDHKAQSLNHVVRDPNNNHALDLTGRKLMKSSLRSDCIEGSNQARKLKECHRTSWKWCRQKFRKELKGSKKRRNEWKVKDTRIECERERSRRNEDSDRSDTLNGYVKQMTTCTFSRRRKKQHYHSTLRW